MGAAEWVLPYGQVEEALVQQQQETDDLVKRMATAQIEEQATNDLVKTEAITPQPQT